MYAPVCVSCRCPFRCVKNEFLVKNGTQYWYGDKWKCPGCGHEIVTGFAKKPTFKSSLSEEQAAEAMAICESYGFSPKRVS